MSQHYREMLLEDLVKDYAPVYPEGEDWEKTASYLYSEEPELMKSLSESLRTNGWREPILISTNEDLSEGESPKVYNGTHRVAIALYEGVISVPVTTAEESENDNFNLDFITKLTVKVAMKDNSSEEDRDEVFEALFTKLRSFALTEDIWLNSDMASSNTPKDGSFEVELYYELPNDQHHKLLRRIVKKAIPTAITEPYSLKIELEKIED